MPVSRIFRGLALAATSVLCSGLFLAKPALAAAPQAWVGAKILNGKGEVIENGVLLVQDGRISAVGPADRVSIPENTEKINATGRVIIPGIIDSHSHLGIYSRPAVPANSDGNEMTGPVQPGVRALDATDPADPGIPMARAGGVTTANIMPGSGNVIGGQTLYVKLREPAPSRDDGHPRRADRRPQDGQRREPQAGLRPQGSTARHPHAPRRHAARAVPQGARLSAEVGGVPGGEGRRQGGRQPPETDLSLEPLVEVIERKRTVHFHSHRADDILTVARLADEFGFEVVLQHGTEAYKIADELAEKGIPVSLTLLDSPGGKAEVVDLSEECGRELNAARVKVLINTDDPVTESRFLLRSAAIAVRGGLPENVALKGLTPNAAKLQARRSHRLARTRQGRRFRPPERRPIQRLDARVQTYIDGRKVFDLDDDLQRRYQTGGFDLPRAESVPRYPLVPPSKPLGKPMTLPASSKAVGEQTTEFRILAHVAYSVSGGVIQDALIHVKDGKIESIKPLAGQEIPRDLPLLSAAAVTPGLIDAFSAVPLSGELNVAADQDLDQRAIPMRPIFACWTPSTPRSRCCVSCSRRA